MFNLAGQIALVTGGSQGIGLATALTLARSGADVAVMSRSLDKCETAAAEIRALGRRGLAVRGVEDVCCQLSHGVVWTMVKMRGVLLY